MRILGIETSCDETAAAVVDDGLHVRSNVISSQIALHSSHGGVVPELAARGQVTAITTVVQEALAVANCTRADIDAIAVTHGPGLAGSLLVGVNTAKTLAYLLNRPLVPVNHLEGHIYANWLTLPGAEPVAVPAFPLLCLLVSGGHTELIMMRRHGHFEHLGRTLDDAAGEAFDKGARLLGLGYPGGPAIQKASVGGDLTRFALPRAWLGDSDDFSFSGLKTALLRIVEPYRIRDDTPRTLGAGGFVEHRPPRYTDEMPLADLAAGFQAAIIDVLATKAARVAKRMEVKTVLIAGGVAANAMLRDRLQSELERTFDANPPRLRYPPLALCTDNAAMIAGAGAFALQRGIIGDWAVDVSPRLPVGSN